MLHLVVPEAGGKARRYREATLLYEVKEGVDWWGLPFKDLKALAHESLPHTLVAPWEASKEAVNAMIAALGDLCAGWDRVKKGDIGNANGILSPPSAPYPNSHDWLVATGPFGAQI